MAKNNAVSGANMNGRQGACGTLAVCHTVRRSE